MNILSPSILSADFGILANDVDETIKNGAEYIHIDVMDGMFVPNISIGICVISSLRVYCDKVFDVHLMINNPERYIERFATAGADIITIHVESTDSVKETIELIHSFGKKAGIAINPETPIDSILEYIPMVDMVLAMTVVPGFGGQKLISSVVDKIRELKKYRENHGLSFDIEADGGITLDNTQELLDAGVNIIVAGSSIFQKNKIAENTRAFMKVLNCSEERA